MSAPQIPSAMPRSPDQDAPVPHPRNRAGRNLPAAIGSGVALAGAALLSLFVWQPTFMVIVVGAVVVAVWELHHALAAAAIRFPREPVLLGGVAAVLAAYFAGVEALAVATALTALATMMWRLRGGVSGYVRDTTAGVFTTVYVSFLGGFVALLLAGEHGARAILTFIVVTVVSDIGGYAVGVVAGRHPMAPVVSPKKTWEGFAGSVASCLVAGWALVVYLLDGPWWAGLVLGAVTVVAATMGDLCESVIKRDIGVKDMSQIIPGHGGLMDRLDSLLATAAPVWLVLHYLVLR